MASSKHMTPLSPTTDAIQQAVDILQQGGLVAFPTETVYGLGADARNPEALQRLYTTKGRPTSHPVIVHLSSVDQLPDWAVEIPELAYALAERFWPGPMTLILKRHPQVLDAVTGGQDTVGIRLPQHPVAQELLTAFGDGLAAPSANRFGRLSPTCAQDVRQDLGGAVDLILDGGACPVGIESTIVDLSMGRPRILRPGMLTSAQLEQIGANVSEIGKMDEIKSSDAPLPHAPGTLPSHYAPETPVHLMSTADLQHLCQGEGNFPHRLAGVALMVRTPMGIKTRMDEERFLVVEQMPTDPATYAQVLYQTLRRLDNTSCQHILVEAVPSNPAWVAIGDRLQRAAAVSVLPPGLR